MKEKNLPGKPILLEMNEFQSEAIRSRIIANTVAVRIPEMDTDCWEWQGSKSLSGYGQVSLLKRDGFPKVITKRAHRAAYAAFVGPALADLHVEHLCHNKLCCNPEHLSLCEPTVNMRRKPTVLENRTYCNSGRHILSEVGIVYNTRRGPNGESLPNGTTCKACHVERSARNHLARKARRQDVAS